MNDPYAALGAFTAIIFVMWFFVCLLLLPYCCGMIARNKGYPVAAARAMGFLFGLVALLYYAGLPDKKLQDMLDPLRTFTIRESATMQFAPLSKETIDNPETE